MIMLSISHKQYLVNRWPSGLQTSRSVLPFSGIQFGVECCFEVK